MPTIGEILYGVGADTSRLRAALADVKNFTQTMDQAANATANASAKIKGASEAAGAATKGAASGGEAFAASMQNLARAASLTAGPLSGVAFRITLLGELLGKGTLQTALLVAGMAGAAYGFVKLGEAAVSTEMHLTEIRNSLFALSGNMLQTRMDMNFVMDTADKFGLKFSDVAHAFTNLDIAARGTKLQGEGIREMFVQIMSVAGTLSMSQERLAGVLGFVERMLSLGIVQWRNLREAAREIPNIMELVSQAIGVKTVAGIEKFLKMGTTMSDVLLPKIISAWAKSFGIDAQKPVDNLVAAHNRLQNAILRFNNALDQSAGLSAGAQRTYVFLANALDTLTKNMETVVKVAGVVVGALAGFASTYVISGLLAVAGAVRGIAAAVGILDVAIAASPGGAILKLIAVIAGAAGAYLMLNSSINSTTTGLIGGKVAVDEYVKSWDKFKTGFSSTTTAMIADANQQIDLLKAQLQGAADDLRKAGDAANKAFSAGDTAKFTAATDAIKKAQAVYDGYQKSLEGAVKGVLDLNRVLAEQKKAEAAVPGIQPGENAALQRMLNSLEKVRESTRELTSEWAAMQQAPFAVQKALEQAKIDKSIQDIRIQLQQAGYDWDRTKQVFVDPKVQVAFENYARALQRVRDAQLFDKNFVQGWQVLEFAIETVTKTGIDGMISALEKGKLTWKSMQTIATQVIDAIIKKLLELAVINPMLNALFGGAGGKALPTFVLTGPGTQPGGFFGWLFGGGGGGAPGTAPAAGMSSAAYVQHSGRMGTQTVVPSYLFFGARRLHNGGLAGDEYPAILQRGEKVIPKGGGTAGGNNVSINISHPTGTEAQVKKESVGGTDMYNVIISHVQKGFSQGKFDQVSGTRFGFRPSSIRR